MNAIGTLTFFCGKMGAGKSTKARKLSLEKNTLLISEGEWLATLYPTEISSFDDYIKYSAILRPLMKTHVQKILLTGTNVVLDFPANTAKQRMWFKELCEEIKAGHNLIFIDVSDERCLEQISKRRIEQPKRAPFDTKEMFLYVSKHFEAPLEKEGLLFNVIN